MQITRHGDPDHAVSSSTLLPRFTTTDNELSSHDPGGARAGRRCLGMKHVRMACGLALLWSSLSGIVRCAAAAPAIDLPDGFVARIAAAPPLVGHPIMATPGGPGQLFVGDAAGVNLNKAGLEKEL